MLPVAFGNLYTRIGFLKRIHHADMDICLTKYLTQKRMFCIKVKVFEIFAKGHCRPKTKLSFF